jgi:hypothetical protein
MGIEVGNKEMAYPHAGRGSDGGIAFARTREGFELPVIDVTNPRFALPSDPAAVDRLGAALMADEQRRRYIPDFVTRMMLRSAAHKSRLVRALFHQTGFLDSISTYVMKLGADNLVPPYDSSVDRRLASSPHIVLIRLRMQQVAHLMAGALADDLSGADAAAPLCLINIGGGPALDSINALIVLRKAQPGLLNRPITIDVLDASADGAFFGANALAALKAEHGPLADLDIVMHHHDYDWDRPAMLETLVGRLASAGAVIAASSEGALFEYGSDQAVVENLKVLRANGAGARFVAGSVTSAHNTRRRMINRTLFKLKPRGLNGIAPLVAQGGFRIVRTEPAFLSTQVLLRPA